MRKLIFPLVLAFAASLAGCEDAIVVAVPDLLGPVDEVVAARPAKVAYPDDYAADVTYPLVVMLHGFGANVVLEELIFRLESVVDERQFILILPEGTRNPEGGQFWNATNECCDFFNQEPDDVAYISNLIAEARMHFNIDASRIALVGHSNGGYMANRYACDQAGALERVTRIVNLAGLSFVDAADCRAERPVDVLHLHGTADDRVPYESNVTDPSQSNPDVGEEDARLRAGAFELASRWAERAGCGLTPIENNGVYNLSEDVDGNETDEVTWPNCSRGSSTLLRANGAGHTWLDGNDQFRRVIVDFALR